jgi:hypothetical protein
VTFPGLPARRLDQVRRPGSPATAPGSSSVVRARYVIISGPGDGAFAYIGTPGLGNPPVSWLTGGALVDPYGNVLPSTLGVEGDGTFSVSGGAGTTFIGANTIAIVPAGGLDSAIFGAPAPGQAYIVSGTSAATDVEGFLYLMSKAAGGALVPIAILTGDLVASLPGGTAVQPEVWHFPALLNGWANAAGFGQFRYRLTPWNSVRVVGTISAAAATSTTFFTLPAHYIPVEANGAPVGLNAADSAPAGAVPQMRWDISGDLAIFQAAALPNAGVFFISADIALD